VTAADLRTKLVIQLIEAMSPSEVLRDHEGSNKLGELRRNSARE